MTHLLNFMCLCLTEVISSILVTVLDVYYHCRSFLFKLSQYPSSMEDLERLPYWFANYHILYQKHGVERGMQTAAIIKGLPRPDVCSRVYFMGKRVIGIAEGMKPPTELMSLLASPSFYNAERFSGLVARVPNAADQADGEPSYYFGQAR